MAVPRLSFFFAPGHGFRCSGSDSGVTGRIGAWASTFILVGGYDEGMEPSGYQDINLVWRMKILSKELMKNAVGWQDGWCPKFKFVAGESLANDRAAGGPGSGHGTAQHLTAKTVNCCSTPGGPKTWGKMNALNMARSFAWTKQGRWWRNTGLPLKDVTPGMPTAADLELLKKFCKAVGDPGLKALHPAASAPGLQAKPFYWRFELPGNSLLKRVFGNRPTNWSRARDARIVLRRTRARTSRPTLNRTCAQKGNWQKPALPKPRRPRAQRVHVQRPGSVRTRVRRRRRRGVRRQWLPVPRHPLALPALRW